MKVCLFYKIYENGWYHNVCQADECALRRYYTYYTLNICFLFLAVGNTFIQSQGEGDFLTLFCDFTGFDL